VMTATSVTPGFFMSIRIA